MGISGIGMWHLLTALAIVLLLFGGRHLHNLGSDFGVAIRGFTSAMSVAEKDSADAQDLLDGKSVGGNAQVTLRQYSSQTSK